MKIDRTVQLALLAAILIAGVAEAGSPSGSHDVRIRRDEWGVPHILGKTDADAAYGLGYAQAEDDFATLQRGVLQARGLLASIDGPSGLDSDYLVALEDVWGTIARRYDQGLPQDVKAVLEAYAGGINAYVAKHPEKSTANLGAFTGRDMVAETILNGPTFYGLDGIFRRTLAPKAKHADLPRPLQVAELGSETLPTGSNGLAIAPSRSSDGATRLLVNSHQPYAGPFAWYEAVVESGQGWHVTGGFFPGSPFMLHGHNAHLGWANTVNNPDLADVYELKINPENPDQYQLDGSWKTLEKRLASIKVRQSDGTFSIVNREVLRSVHGPAMRTDHGTFAIRYAGLDEIRQPQQYLALNKAKSLGEWKAAMSLQALPSINYVYADEKGNVGYVYNGKFPVRKEGVDWSGIVAGDKSELIPTKLIPFAAVPQLWNPKSGLVFNSNNTPFRASDPTDDLKPAAYSKTLGIQTNMTNRAYRVLETYGVDKSITADEFTAYKYDLSYSSRSDAAKIITAVAAIDAKGDPDVLAAQAMFKAWDFRTDTANRNTALVLVTAQRFLQNPGFSPLPALQETIADLRAHFGRIDPQWGEVNRIRRGGLSMPIDGGPDVFRAVYGQRGPDGRWVAMAGDTYVMFVTWDRGGNLSSRSIHQFGSATLDETSPHYADQTPLFAQMKTKPVLFTEDQLKGHVVRDYVPGE